MRLRSLVSLTLAVVLSGTPAVAAACAAWCLPQAAHGAHAEGHGAVASHHAADVAEPDPHQHHHSMHQAAPVAATPDTSSAVPETYTPRATGVSLTPALDCCAAPVSTVTVAWLPGGRPDAVAVPAVRPVPAFALQPTPYRLVTAPVHPPPPAPPRAPLTLRI